MKVIKVLFIIMFSVYCFDSYANSDHTSRNNMIVTPISFSEEGLLQVMIHIELAEENNLYNWRGHLYPIFGSGLLFIPDKKNEAIVATITNKIIPKFPHKQDIISTKSYKYPQLLTLQIREKNKDVFLGCLNFKLIYNTSDLHKIEQKLSSLYIESNYVTICNN